MNIILIEKNNCRFDQLGEYASGLLYQSFSKEERQKIKAIINEYIWHIISPYIKHMTINDPNDVNERLTAICTNIAKVFPDKELDQLFFYTEGSYSFPKKYIELVHAQPLWKTYQLSQPANINYLGCLFSLEQHIVENNCIILSNSYQLNHKPYVQACSTTNKDIVKVIRRRFFFSSVFIKDHVIEKYYYQDPQILLSKLFGLSFKDNIQKLSFAYFGYNLVFYFQQDKSKYINQMATRINGSYIIHGDVLVLHELDEGIFSSINLDELSKLDMLSYGKLSNRETKKQEEFNISSTEVDENGNPIEDRKIPFWSKYLIIQSRLNELKDYHKCYQCQGDIKEVVNCQKCYRLRLCSDQCYQKYLVNHNDCITEDDNTNIK